MSIGLLIKQILREDTIKININDYIRLTDSQRYDLKDLGYEIYDLSRLTGKVKEIYLMRPLDTIEIIKYEIALRNSYKK